MFALNGSGAMDNIADAITAIAPFTLLIFITDSGALHLHYTETGYR